MPIRPDRLRGAALVELLAGLGGGLDEGDGGFAFGLGGVEGFLGDGVVDLGIEARGGDIGERTEVHSCLLLVRERSRGGIGGLGEGLKRDFAQAGVEPRSSSTQVQRRNQRRNAEGTRGSRVTGGGGWIGKKVRV